MDKNCNEMHTKPVGSCHKELTSGCAKTCESLDVLEVLYVLEVLLLDVLEVLLSEDVNE